MHCCSRCFCNFTAYRTAAPYSHFQYPGMPDSVYTVAKPDKNPAHIYQRNYIGGSNEADAYHFYPVLVEGNRAKIFPHHHKLQYNRSYYVTIDESVFSSACEFISFYGPHLWVRNTDKNHGNVLVASITYRDRCILTSPGSFTDPTP